MASDRSLETTFREVSMELAKSADGTGIAWNRGGSGPVLVVVNGALSDHTSTDMLRHWLEPHFTVVGYDRRGRGESGDNRPYAIEREIEDLAAVIAANGSSAVVYGHSSGAVLALEAAMHDLPIDRLAVNEPPYILPGTRPLPAPEVNGQLALLAQHGDRAAMIDLFLREMVGVPGGTVRQMEQSPQWPAMLELAPSARYDALLLGRFELPQTRLSALGVKTLVLAGGASYDWIIATARAVADLIPRAEYHVLPGQSHSPAPHVLCAHLIGFFGS
jgi:pimeloyl-ACP methyl ester carboxylesterase